MRFKRISPVKNIEGVYIYEPSIGEDERGSILTLFSESEILPEHITMVEDKISFSKKNVFRGLHGDNITWKYITCLYGGFQLGLLDARKNSPTRGHTYNLVFDDRFPKSILVPPGVLNGHLALSDCRLFYKWSHYYQGPEKQITVPWFQTNIDWLIKPEIVCERDRTEVNFEDIQL